MPDRKSLPGKFVWFELVSKDAKKAQAFYGEVLGWTVKPFPMGSYTYEMIYAGETMIGGYAQPKKDGTPSHWISYVSVEDVDAAAKVAAANGGKIIDPPSDIPDVGRTVRIADPQGAELCLFKSNAGDPPDVTLTPPGFWLWNELHTTDPAKAIAFYEKVVGYTHKAMDMGPGGTYYILSKGSDDGRAGVTKHLPPGVAPHWLPYVSVADVDVTVGRARKLGGEILMPGEDIPDVGRIGVLKDPTGAALAVMKPFERAK